MHLYTKLAASIITMGIMFNCLYTIPLCNFDIAFSHAICVIVKYFGKLLLKYIWQPKSSHLLSERNP